MSEEANKKAVLALVDALHRRDAEAWVAAYTEDATVRWMMTGRVIQGREAVRQWLADIDAIFGNLEDEILGIYADGDTVVLELVAHSTLAVDYKDKTAGTRLNAPEVFIYRLVDGKVAEQRCYY